MGTEQEEGKEVLHFFYDVSHVCPCHCIPSASLCLRSCRPHPRQMCSALLPFPSQRKWVRAGVLEPDCRGPHPSPLLISWVAVGPLLSSRPQWLTCDRVIIWHILIEDLLFADAEEAEAQRVLVNPLKVA